MSETADLFMPEAGTTKLKPSTAKWSVQRVHERATGYRGISIFDERGLRVANIVMQLDESEMKIAKRIVDAVNASRNGDGER